MDRLTSPKNIDPCLRTDNSKPELFSIDLLKQASRNQNSNMTYSAKKNQYKNYQTSKYGSVKYGGYSNMKEKYQKIAAKPYRFTTLQLN